MRLSERVARLEQRLPAPACATCGSPGRDGGPVIIMDVDGAGSPSVCPECGLAPFNFTITIAGPRHGDEHQAEEY